MKSSLENLNIALVHDWLTNMAGAERVLFNIAEIFPNATIFTSVYDQGGAEAFASRKIITSYLQKYPMLKKKREFLIPFTPLAFESFDLGKYDVVITNTTFPAKGVITKPETVHICYCHTPTRYLWEPEIDPRTSKGFLLGLRRKTALKLKPWDLAAADRPDHYLANSNYIKNRIKKYYHRDSQVIYPPVNVNKFSPAKNPKDIKDYYLFVSRLIGYKKCDLVIEAFNKLELPLKIIGRGPEKKQLQKMAKSNIEFLGYLSDEEMKKYYREAKAFVFAAEEDFGIVPVEAMAAGRPVIAYGKGGAAETVVDGRTGLLFYKQSAESLVEAVKKFKPEKYKVSDIRHQAERFSEERFRKEFKKAVEKIIFSNGTDWSNLLN